MPPNSYPSAALPPFFCQPIDTHRGTTLRRRRFHVIISMKNFTRAEDGAVTIDWVVLTAAIVTLGIAVMLSVGGPTTDLADNVGSTVGDYDIATY